MTVHRSSTGTSRYFTDRHTPTPFRTAPCVMTSRSKGIPTRSVALACAALSEFRLRDAVVRGRKDIGLFHLTGSCTCAPYTSCIEDVTSVKGTKEDRARLKTTKVRKAAPNRTQPDRTLTSCASALLPFPFFVTSCCLDVAL